MMYWELVTGEILSQVTGQSLTGKRNRLLVCHRALVQGCCKGGSRLSFQAKLEAWWIWSFGLQVPKKLQASHPVGVRQSRLWLSRQSSVKLSPALLDQKVNSSEIEKGIRLPIYACPLELVWRWADSKFSLTGWEMRKAYILLLPPNFHNFILLHLEQLYGGVHIMILALQR